MPRLAPVLHRLLAPSIHNSSVPTWARPPALPFPLRITGACNSSSISEPAVAQGDQLAAWVQDSGGEVDGLKVANAGASGWCLSASRALPAGTVLVKLPEACLLTYNESTDQNVLDLVDKVPDELWGAKLALQVLSQRAAGDGSPFETYIGLLPKAVEGLPMFFSGPAIKALQYPTLISQVVKRCKFLIEFSEKAIAPISCTTKDPFGGQIVDANALGWALAVVTSRAFRTRGPSHPASMLPLIDMCNHSFEPNCEVRPAGGGAVELVTKREVAEGEELLLSYGPLGNDFLLLDYGFVVDGNPHDTCQLAYDLSLFEAARAVQPQLGLSTEGEGDEELKLWQQQLLSEIGLASGSNEMTFLGGPPDQPVDRRLLAVARVMSAEGPEDVRILRQGAGSSGSTTASALGSWNRPLPTPAQEAAALRLVLAVGALSLSRFPTQLDDDVAALKTGTLDGEELGPDVRAAVSFRVQLKQAILRSLEAVSSKVKELAPSAAALAAAGGQARRATKKAKATAKSKRLRQRGNGKKKGKKGK